MATPLRFLFLRHIVNFKDKSAFLQQLLKSAFVKDAHIRFDRAAAAAPADLPPLQE
jgi:hypothetical protein